MTRIWVQDHKKNLIENMDIERLDLTMSRLEIQDQEKNLLREEGHLRSVTSTAYSKWTVKSKGSE